MKRLYSIKVAAGIITIVMGTLMGCDDALEENPEGFISPENFYQTEADALTAVTGLYARWSSGDLFGRDLEMITMHGDPAVTPNRVITIPQSRYDYTPTFGDFADIWESLYRIIGDANKAIGRLEESQLDQEAKDQFIGEALFHRALAYYYLSALYGGAPLWTVELTDNADEIANLPRATAPAIRAQVITDLTRAADLLPDNYSGNFDKVRATRWAAKSLLAKTYLYEEDWENAAREADDVITESGHSLLPDYGDVFTEENEYSNEIIFTVDFQQEVVTTSRGFRYAPRSRDEDPANRENWMNGFGHYVMRQSFIDTYDPADSRLDAIIQDTNNAGEALRFIYLKKMQRTANPLDKQGVNMILFRFADMLLVHAEAANEDDDLAGALTSINRVRQRAGLPDLSGLDKDQLRQAIYQERSWELVGENHTKMDLARWGLLISEIKALPAKAEAAGEPNGPQAMAQIQADNISDKHLLLPVPQAEFEKNPNLGQQNPGWEGG
ncbi:RagB/SusD family nutrient uptake outer membrane protein [Fulvivirga sp. M361]|uniref:RagB/SusD family nutrient uptake outer membrane protein n=1 Tax=Fulvivirga sp. M361 TaxID=2594266 RepID=UPI00117BA39A|nr:RagB/SusD family nutrient uptake outer membrane protein [Fulvivirga sp. M361]TRX49680.1 RagB/SusD family nutrient uptake outer membrane protein [Fulvivirga sp. M361]